MRNTGGGYVNNNIALLCLDCAGGVLWVPCLYRLVMLARRRASPQLACAELILLSSTVESKVDAVTPPISNVAYTARFT